MARTKQVARRATKEKVPDKQPATPPAEESVPPASSAPDTTMKTRSQRMTRMKTRSQLTTRKSCGGKAPRKWKATKVAKKTVPYVNTPPDAESKATVDKQATSEAPEEKVPEVQVATTSAEENSFALPDVAEIQAWLLAEESSLLLQEAAGMQAWASTDALEKLCE